MIATKVGFLEISLQFNFMETDTGKIKNLPQASQLIYNCTHSKSTSRKIRINLSIQIQWFHFHLYRLQQTAYIYTSKSAVSIPYTATTIVNEIFTRYVRDLWHSNPWWWTSFLQSSSREMVEHTKGCSNAWWQNSDFLLSLLCIQGFFFSILFFLSVYVVDWGTRIWKWQVHTVEQNRGHSM